LIGIGANFIDSRYFFGANVARTAARKVCGIKLFVLAFRCEECC